MKMCTLLYQKNPRNNKTSYPVSLSSIFSYKEKQIFNMRKISLFIALIALVTSCKEEPGNNPQPQPEPVKKISILGSSFANTDAPSKPTLWTDKRETNFLPTLNNTHYYMEFMQKVNSKWNYFGREQVWSPSKSRIVMWADGIKTVLADKVGFSPSQEYILNYSINPTNNDAYILVNDGDVAYYYYKITNNGSTVTRHEFSILSTDKTPIHIQAIGSDVHVIAIGHIPSTETEDIKTIVEHYKNGGLYSSYTINTPDPGDATEYWWNNINPVHVYIQNDITHIIGQTNTSGHYYYVKLAKNVTITPNKLNLDGYELPGGKGVFENNKFYIAGRKLVGDAVYGNPAYFVIDIQSTAPTVQKKTLEVPTGYSSYYPYKIFKFGEDVYASGWADAFGVYWKNDKVTVLNKTDIMRSSVADIVVE